MANKKPVNRQILKLFKKEKYCKRSIKLYDLLSKYAEKNVFGVLFVKVCMPSSGNVTHIFLYAISCTENVGFMYVTLRARKNVTIAYLFSVVNKKVNDDHDRGEIFYENRCCPYIELRSNDGMIAVNKARNSSTMP